MVTLSINISAMNIKCIKKKCSKNEKTENILKNRSYINEARSKSRKIENPFDIDKSPTKKKRIKFYVVEATEYAKATLHFHVNAIKYIARSTTTIYELN